MATGRHVRGFTLTEMAVVLAIVGLLLGSMMITFSTQVEQRNFAETERRLDEAKELLLAFAIVNGRLPCPATCANPPLCTSGSGGDEVRTIVSPFPCVTYRGYLPARAIGFQPTGASGFALDAWNNPIRYAVASTVQPSTSCPAVPATNPPSLLTSEWSPPFTTAISTGLPDTTTFMKANGIGCLTGTSDLFICRIGLGVTANTGADCPTSDRVTNQNVVAAVVLSTGRNGAVAPVAGTYESENTDGDAVFVYRAPDPSSVITGEYDDLTTWIPVGLLYARMIAAGVLP